MKQMRELLTLAALLAFAWPAAPSQAAERNVRFAPGATAVMLKGVIRGDGDATYVLQTIDGQVLQALLTTSNRSCYFNVYEPGQQQEAAHIGSGAGNEYSLDPATPGTYRFQIYLMRNAARRNEACRYSLSIELYYSLSLESPEQIGNKPVSDRQMRDQCQTVVAAMYAVPSERIRLAAIRKGRQGPLINGAVDKGAEGIKKFRCLYTPDRRLRDVMAMTPDGE